MAKNKINLQIIAPDRTVLDEEVDAVVLPSTEGEMGVLYDHEPVVVLLGYNVMRYKQDGKEKRVTIMSGFAEVTKDRVIILTDASEFPEEIDLERAKAARERAEKRLASAEADTKRAEVALKKAIIRMKISEDQ